MTESVAVLRKELEIYIHIPFCVKKCAYCDFLSAPADESIRRAYVDRLIQEISEFELSGEYTVSTVFLGGGTPSILPCEDIERILEALKEKFPYWVCRERDGFEPELTIECNPGTLTAGRLESFRRAGINRLSIGLQSAQNEELKKLGRIHSYEEFLENYFLARDAGFTNINIDLMSALPGQSIRSFQDTLHRVCELSPEHISAYSLIVEKDTPFYAVYEEDVRRRDAGEKPVFLPSEEEERQMYFETQKILSAYGYHRYEISNYAKHGYECRHNIGYWRRTDYVGFGLGAASMQNPIRYKNTVLLEDYLEGDFSKKELFVLTKDNQIEETMFLGLRMTQGVSLSEFEKIYNCPLTAVYAEQIEKLKSQGLLEADGGYIRLTSKGTDVSNVVLAEFLLD